MLFLIWKKIVFFFNKNHSLHQQGFFYYLCG
nr:MAG TPA: aminopeptidase [Caudoviricetes sp.]